MEGREGNIWSETNKIPTFGTHKKGDRTESDHGTEKFHYII